MKPLAHMNHLLLTAASRMTGAARMSKKAADDSARKLSNASTCSTEALSEADQSESCASATTKPAETSWFDMALHHVGGLVLQLPHAAQVGDALQALTSYPQTKEQETREALALKDEQLVRAAAEAAAAKRRVEELTQQLQAVKVAKASTARESAALTASQQALARVQGELGGVQAGLSSTKKKLACTETDLQRSESRMCNTLAELSACTKKLSETEAKVATAVERAVSVRKEMKVLEGQLSAKDHQVNDLRSSAAERKQQMGALKKQLTAAEQRIAKLEVDRDSVEQWQQQATQAKLEVRALRNQVAQRDAQLQESSDLVETLMRAVAAANAAAEAAAGRAAAVAAAAPNTAAQAALEELQTQNACVVCMHSTRSVLIQPCRHWCLCADCAKENTFTSCPMCRGAVSCLETVHMS
jgi:chromosome segregation ATPase